MNIKLALLMVAGLGFEMANPQANTVIVSSNDPDPDLELDLLARVPPEVLPEGRHELATVRRHMARDFREMNEYRGRHGVDQDVRDLLGQRVHRLREVLDIIDLRLLDLERAARSQAAPPPEPAPPLPPEPSRALAVDCRVPGCAAPVGVCCKNMPPHRTHKERVTRWQKLRKKWAAQNA